MKLNDKFDEVKAIYDKLHNALDDTSSKGSIKTNKSTIDGSLFTGFRIEMAQSEFNFAYDDGIFLCFSMPKNTMLISRRTKDEYLHFPIEVEEAVEYIKIAGNIETDIEKVKEVIELGGGIKRKAIFSECFIFEKDSTVQFMSESTFIKDQHICTVYGDIRGFTILGAPFMKHDELNKLVLEISKDLHFSEMIIDAMGNSDDISEQKAKMKTLRRGAIAGKKFGF